MLVRSSVWNAATSVPLGTARPGRSARYDSSMLSGTRTLTSVPAAPCPLDRNGFGVTDGHAATSANRAQRGAGRRGFAAGAGGSSALSGAGFSAHAGRAQQNQIRGARAARRGLAWYHEPQMLRRTVPLALLVASCSTGVAPPKPASRGGATPEPARASPSEPEVPSVSPRGWLGVEVSVPPDADGGVLVRTTVRGSPAERAGIEAGDRILTLDGAAVIGPEDVVRLVAARAPGSRIPLVVRRGAAQRLLSAELGATPDATSVMKMSFVGAAAPRLVALDPVQGSVDPDLGSLKGRVVVLEFWAPWCAVCRFMVPKLNDWHARLSAQGVVVLGITMDAVVPATHAAGQLGIEYPVASDHSGKTTAAYRANALPTLFVIDQKGMVRDVLVGYSSDRLQQLEHLVRDLTGER